MSPRGSWSSALKMGPGGLMDADLFFLNKWRSKYWMAIHWTPALQWPEKVQAIHSHMPKGPWVRTSRYTWAAASEDTGEGLTLDLSVSGVQASVFLELLTCWLDASLHCWKPLDSMQILGSHLQGGPKVSPWTSLMFMFWHAKETKPQTHSSGPTLEQLGTPW